MQTLYSFAHLVPRWIYRIVALFLYCLVLVLGAAEPAVDALPGRDGYSAIYHLLFYFGLGGLLWFSLRKPSVLAVTVLVIIAGAIDELHQHFLPFRHGRISDVLIDTSAGLMAALVLYRLRINASSGAALKN